MPAPLYSTGVETAGSTVASESRSDGRRDLLLHTPQRACRARLDPRPDAANAGRLARLRLPGTRSPEGRGAGASPRAGLPQRQSRVCAPGLLDTVAIRP